MTMAMRTRRQTVTPLQAGLAPSCSGQSACSTASSGPKPDSHESAGRPKRLNRNVDLPAIIMMLAPVNGDPER